MKHETEHWRAWSEEELDFLKENMDKQTAREIAQHIGRTTCAVRGRLAKLRRELDPDSRKNDKWTAEEDEWIIKHEDLSYTDMADYLRRTYQGVASHVCDLRARGLLRQPLSAETEAHYAKRIIQEVVESTGLDMDTIRNMRGGAAAQLARQAMVLLFNDLNITAVKMEGYTEISASASYSLLHIAKKKIKTSTPLQKLYRMCRSYLSDVFAN